MAPKRRGAPSAGRGCRTPRRSSRQRVAPRCGAWCRGVPGEQGRGPPIWPNPLLRGSGAGVRRANVGQERQEQGNSTGTPSRSSCLPPKPSPAVRARVSTTKPTGFLPRDGAGRQGSARSFLGFQRERLLS